MSNYGFYPNVPVLIEDIRDGQQWPPTRLQARIDRFREREELAAGDYSSVIEDTKKRKVIVNRIGAYLDTVSALLLATNPGEGLEDRRRYELQNMLDNAARDACKHGKAIMIELNDRLMTMPIRNAFPVGDSEAWLFIEPKVTASSLDGRPNVLNILIWENDRVSGIIHEYHIDDTSSTGQIGRRVAELPAESARLVSVDKPPSEMGWGSSDVDDLKSVAVEMVLRDSSISYILDQNETPLFAVFSNTNDLPAVKSLLDIEGSDSGDTLTARELSKFAPSLRRHDIVIYPDGVTDARYIEWGQNLDSSFTFSDELEKNWSLVSGMSLTESGDSAEVSSGVAIARRNFRLTAKVARLHGPLYAAAQELVGPFEWEYIGQEQIQDMTEESFGNTEAVGFTIEPPQRDEE